MIFLHIAYCMTHAATYIFLFHTAAVYTAHSVVKFKDVQGIPLIEGWSPLIFFSMNIIEGIAVNEKCSWECT